MPHMCVRPHKFDGSEIELALTDLQRKGLRLVVYRYCERAPNAIAECEAYERVTFSLDELEELAFTQRKVIEALLAEKDHRD